MDRLFTTTTLAGIIQSLFRPPSFLVDRYFGRTVNFDTLKVTFDLVIKKRRLAAFVAPSSKGKLISPPAFGTNEYSGAYVKEQTSFDPNRAFVRAIGERIGGGMYSPMERQQLNVAIALNERSEALARRKEQQAAAGLVDGKVVISGEGIPEQTIDFRRDPSLTIVLTGSDRWSDAGSNPITTIQAAVRQAHRVEGAVIEDVVMDPDAWDAAWTNEAFQEALDVRRFDSGTVSVGPQATPDGVMFMGRLGNINLYVYSDIYIDEDDNEVPFLPSGAVVGVTKQLQGIQLHGAIVDEQAKLQPLTMFARSWVDNETSQRQLQTHSNMLVAPTRPNGSFVLFVL